MSEKDSKLVSVPAPAERGPKDYAIEFGGYLADSAERFQTAYNLRRMAEDSDEEVDIDAFADALTLGQSQRRRRRRKISLDIWYHWFHNSLMMNGGNMKNNLITKLENALALAIYRSDKRMETKLAKALEMIVNSTNFPKVSA